MLFQKLHKAKQYIIGSLLVVFVAPFLCSWLCGMEIMSVPNRSNLKAVNHPTEEVRYHFILDFSASDTKTFRSMESSHDECCENELSIVDLIKNKTQEFDFGHVQQMYPAFLVEEYHLLPIKITYFPVQRTSWFHYTGVSIRILFQSFLW